MKKVIIAPDSFKGTLSSQEVCEIVGERLMQLYADVTVKQLPLADGGEGTAQAFLQAFSGKKLFTTAKSPLGRDIEAYYVMLEDKSAVIETAVASGLTAEKKNDALLASCYGTGQLVKKALDDSAQRLIIGVGGSAMTDGGTGFLSALGVKFFDAFGNELFPCGRNLIKIDSIDPSGLDERLKKIETVVLCDVKNTLYGENGAAYIFAPQKGATKHEVELLDRGLRNFARVCEKTLKEDFSLQEGTGAAGGLGFALKAFLNARLESGIDFMLDICDFQSEAESAELIITGEGKLDSQSLMGKVITGLSSRSKQKRLVVLTGTNELSKAEIEKAGISQVIETNPLHLPFDEIKNCAKTMLFDSVEKIIV